MGKELPKDFGEMNGYAKQVNKECCYGPGESCKHGFPSKCDAGCAAVLMPMQQRCGKFMKDVAPTALTRLKRARAPTAPIPRVRVEGVKVDSSRLVPRFP